MNAKLIKFCNKGWPLLSKVEKIFPSGGAQGQAVHHGTEANTSTASELVVAEEDPIQTPETGVAPLPATLTSHLATGSSHAPILLAQNPRPTSGK